MADKDFDINQYIKENAAPSPEGVPSFNPDKYIQANSEHLQSEAPEAQQWSQAESLGQGALQGVTAGFSDEIGGALGAVMEKAANAVGKGTGDKKSLKELYEEYRDFQRKRNEAAHEQNPVSYGAGNIAGGVTGAVLAPAIMAPTSVAGGAALGAAAGLGTSDASLTQPTMGSIAQTGTNMALGAGLGAAGGFIGSKLQAGSTPEALEMAGSKGASEAIGLKPGKEFKTVFNKETGQMINGEEIKGIGKTGIEQGALPLTGGPEAIYINAQKAINVNRPKVSQILNQIQPKLDQNLEQSLDKVGNIGDKAASFMYKFVKEDVPKTSQRDSIVQKLADTYLPQIEELSQNDGNLQALNGLKQDLQEAATSLNSQAYEKADLKPEAEFVKRLGGIVRQHIEDLSKSVDPQSAEQLVNTNQTLSNLYTYKDQAFRLVNKKDTGSSLNKVVSAPIKFATGYNPEQLGQIVSARGKLAASKIIETPVGSLAQKTVVGTPSGVLTNPFSQNVARILSNQEGVVSSSASANQDLPKNQQGQAPATQMSSNLYNATNDSLKQAAEKISQKPGLQFYGNNLKDAIDDNDEGAKIRALHLIMQNPISRKLVTPEEE